MSFYIFYYTPEYDIRMDYDWFLSRQDRQSEAAIKRHLETMHAAARRKANEAVLRQARNPGGPRRNTRQTTVRKIAFQRKRKQIRHGLQRKWQS